MYNIFDLPKIRRRAMKHSAHDAAGIYCPTRFSRSKAKYQQAIRETVGLLDYSQNFQVLQSSLQPLNRTYYKVAVRIKSIPFYIHGLRQSLFKLAVELPSKPQHQPQTSQHLRKVFSRFQQTDCIKTNFRHRTQAQNQNQNQRVIQISSQPFDLKNIQNIFFIFKGGVVSAEQTRKTFTLKLISLGVDREVQVFRFGQQVNPRLATLKGKRLGLVNFDCQTIVEARQKLKRGKVKVVRRQSFNSSQLSECKQISNRLIYPVAFKKQFSIPSLKTVQNQRQEWSRPLRLLPAH